MNALLNTLGIALLLAPVSLAADNDHGGHAHHDPAALITADAAQAAGIAIETAGPAALHETLSLYGRIRPNQEAHYRIAARYPGQVRTVDVGIGDTVEAGQILARIEARDSLQVYALRAPAAGVITARHSNPGANTDGDVLLEIVDTRQVWLELDAFPRDLPRLEPGQPVMIDEQVVGRIDYIAPLADPLSLRTTARARLDNAEGRYQPGTVVSAQVQLATWPVAIAVRAEALQQIDQRASIYVLGDEGFVAQPIETGRSDGEWLEVRAGLAAGDRYASSNSYLLKADQLKSGASHAH
jgi:cobalt-zinc-cadmium efflux system membrane fusion protein